MRISNGAAACTVGLAAVTVLAAGALAAATPATGTAQAAVAAAGATSTVTVDGEGSAIGTPDTLQVSLAVDVVRSDVSGALTAAGADITKVTDALTGDGVAAADIQTSGLNVNSRTDRHGTVTGYEVTEGLSVTLRQFANAGQTLGDAAAAGGNDIRVQGLTPALSDPVALGVSARQHAFADAKARAQQYADLAHLTLGRPITINASSSSPSDNVPASKTTAGVAGSTTVAAPSVPISAGSQSIDVTITVVWSLH